jgi:hypothetical protein
MCGESDSNEAERQRRIRSSTQVLTNSCRPHILTISTGVCFSGFLLVLEEYFDASLPPMLYFRLASSPLHQHPHSIDLRMIRGTQSVRVSVHGERRRRRVWGAGPDIGAASTARASEARAHPKFVVPVASSLGASTYTSGPDQEEEHERKKLERYPCGARSLERFFSCLVTFGVGYVLSVSPFPSSYPSCPSPTCISIR